MSEGVLRSEGAAAPRGGSGETKAANHTPSTVERVARAQQAAEDAFDLDPPCEHESYEEWQERRQTVIARAAIEAMREPTEAMNEAGAANCKSWWTTGRATPVYGFEPGKIFSAMIDRALAEQSHPPAEPLPAALPPLTEEKGEGR